MKETVKLSQIELEPTEYAAFYRGYISNVAIGTIQEILNADLNKWENLFKNISEEEGLKTYAPGKWSIKEMLLHCIDTERIFCTRALMIARGETQNIPGYNHENYVKFSNANRRSLESLKMELFTQRASSHQLFETFYADDLCKTGIANENKLSVRAIAYIIPGHCLHHFNILRERYGIEF